ncbi:MAG TPA: mechanosensitive ion channel protein MscS [Microscillaceae bacterium]|jgi:small conductance mechanosensitive channel|nr:mechanosensitive ion channel protein MscS [Microscillaceae bacterium]
MNWLKLYDSISSYLVKYALNITLAIVAWALGIWLINALRKFIYKALNRSIQDEAIAKFLGTLIVAALRVFLLITVAGILGIETTSFVAVLGAAGLAVGLALQGSLSNFAGGVLILLIKPFEIDDYIAGGGFEGKVESIQVFYTVLITIDNKKISIPNGVLSNSPIVNFTRDGKRAIELKVKAMDVVDLEKAKNALVEAAQQSNLVMPTPAPEIRVLAFDATSVTYNLEVWVNADDYEPALGILQESVKTVFEKHKIVVG